MKNPVVSLVSASAIALIVSGTALADAPTPMSLAQRNACLSCHGVDKKIVGPAFKDVAKRYAGDKTAEARLMTKVKLGGKGAWGDVPMPPNPQVSDADLKTILQWVLSLK
jgi:cytochrome c